MKKLTTILLAGVATLAFTACGGGGGSSDGSTTPPPTETPDLPIVSSPFDTVTELHDGERISAGIFQSSGINYYDLIMSKNGNISIDMHGYRGVYVTLYDENLNLIQDNYWGNFKLNQGNYILKVGYDTFPITLNSNALYDQNKLPIIESGTYTGTTERARKYYKLVMPSDGNIDIDIHGSFVDVTLYDINLNPLETSYWGYHELQAGTYVLGVKYDGQAMTIKSNVF